MPDYGIGFGGAAASVAGDRNRVAPLLFCCAKTVSELHLLEPPGLLFERKQIPQIIVNVRNSRKATEPLETTRVPWAQWTGFI